MTPDEEAQGRADRAAAKTREDAKWKGHKIEYHIAEAPDARTRDKIITATGEWLTQLGQEGWELVGLDPILGGSLYIFKREPHASEKKNADR